MSRICSILVILLLLIFVVPTTYANHQCGNGICQATGHVETCSSCSQDCGSCPVPTAIPTQAPTSAPTATPAPTSSSPTATTAPGQPTSTPAPTSSSGTSGSNGSSSSNSSNTSSNNSPSSSPTYYPAISLNPLTSPTNKSSVTITGSASVENGSIQAVEYSTNGSSWSQAQVSGQSYSAQFSLPEGNYTLRVRAKSKAGVFTQEGNYATRPLTIVTTPPRVTLSPFVENPTKNQTPILTAAAVSSLAAITRVEISLDNGKTWNATRRISNGYTYTPKTLEDENYPVVARAFDNAGNVGTSKTQTLIIDTLPPVIGGTSVAIGPQPLTPTADGSVQTIVGVPITLQVHMKGGPVKTTVSDGTTQADLVSIDGTNLWKGTLSFPTENKKVLKLVAIDGANNRTERELTTLLIGSGGLVQSQEKAIKDASVSVYYYDTISKSWVLWDGESFNQKNPQKTDEEGRYSFILPPGKYYVEVKKAGYKTAQSTIIDLATTTPINSHIELQQIPHATISLPVIGEVTLSLGFLTPPNSYDLQNSFQKDEKNTYSLSLGTQAPHFSLPNTQEKLITLSSYKGKKILLTFITTWSPLAAEQASLLHKTQQTTKDFEIVTIILQESTSAVNTYMKRGNYSFTALADSVGTTANDYKITVLPQHFFVNASGRISNIHTGVLSVNEMIEKMSQVD